MYIPNPILRDLWAHQAPSMSNSNLGCELHGAFLTFSSERTGIGKNCSTMFFSTIAIRRTG